VVSDAGIFAGVEKGYFDEQRFKVELQRLSSAEQVPLLATGQLDVGGGGANPGLGVVAVQDVDNAGWTCHPPHPAWSRLFEGMRAVWGGDLLLTGRRLPGLLRSAGLQNVEFTADHAGVVRRTHPLHMRMLLLAEIVSKRLIDQQVFTRAELIQLMQRLKAHLENPDTFVIAPLRFRAWGWKPVSSGLSLGTRDVPSSSLISVSACSRPTNVLH